MSFNFIWWIKSAEFHPRVVWTFLETFRHKNLPENNLSVLVWRIFYVSVLLDNLSQDGVNNGGDDIFDRTKLWSDVHGKKRKTRSSKDSGSDLFENVDIDKYKTLTTDV